MGIDADILIIGAGASGMAAAIEAAGVSPEAKILLLERSDRAGRKILVTGNGRCNLSNSGIDASCYNSAAAGFSDVMERYADDRSFFRKMGLVTREEREGRIYPYSGQASSVLDALRFMVSASGAETVYGAQVTGILPQENGFTVTAEDGSEYSAAKVIVAAGSPAGAHGFANRKLISSLISQGEGFREFSPALAPLMVRDLPAQLKGTRVQADVTLQLPDGRRETASGEVQFGSGYVSGICVMDLSREYNGEKGAFLIMDLCPDMSCRKIAEFISEVTVIRGNADASTALSGLMQKSVGEVILKTCCDDLYRRKTGSLTSKEIENVSELIKGYKVEVAGKGDFRSAQICRGGFSGLNGETLESAVCNGLYFCGEIVDVDGRCGGYNLHWAWASGRAAGASAASSLKKTPEQ